MATTGLQLATTDDGNALLALDPLALLIGMLLDQQIPMEKAFTSPSVLRERLGGPDRLDAATIAAIDPAEFEILFRTPPALHRFPAAMATRVQALAGMLIEQFDGRAELVWNDAVDGADLVARIARLPGFGPQKARIFAALLGKQFGVRPSGWQEACGAYGEDGFRSIADVVDGASRAKVRATKKEAKQRAKSAAEGG